MWALSGNKMVQDPFYICIIAKNIASGWKAAKKVPPLAVRPLRRGGGGRTTNEKELFLKALNKSSEKKDDN